MNPAARRSRSRVGGSAGSATADAYSQTVSAQVGATFGMTIGLSAAVAASTSTAEATALSGGLGDDLLINDGSLRAESDADADGVVHKEEYVAEYEARLDADLAARRERQMAQASDRFDTLDDDEDGELTQAEFDDSGAWVFGRLDTNGDGAVDDQDTAEAY